MVNQEKMKELDSHWKEVLLQHKGSVLISGYDTGLYQDMLSGWERREAYSYTQTREKKKEVLWMNFHPQKQITLTDMGLR